MKRIVFYSWQSDLPNSTNRGFIQQALESAVKVIAEDDSVAVEPVVDRDTSGVPGSPDIAATIFSKISSADIVVVDISIINNIPGGRPTPNPNVLIELGYALKSLGYERVILVFNEAYGAISDLPFDLRARRLVSYNMPKEIEDRSLERKRLQDILESAVRSALTILPIRKSTPKNDEQPDQLTRDWYAKNSADANRGISALQIPTFLEIKTFLPGVNLHVEKSALKDVVRDSQIHTFGWPIGVYIDTVDKYRPRPDKDGIHAELSINQEDDSRLSYDYWALNQNGSFYLLKSLFEDNRKTGYIFFNTRIVRTAEILMFLSNLYKNLSVNEDQHFLIEIKYSGLHGRTIGASNPDRHVFERKTDENESTVAITTSIKQIDNDLVGTVKKFTGPLFEMFDFFSIDDTVLTDIVEKFKNGQCT